MQHKFRNVQLEVLELGWLWKNMKVFYDKGSWPTKIVKTIAKLMLLLYMGPN